MRMPARSGCFPWLSLDYPALINLRLDRERLFRFRKTDSNFIPSSRSVSIPEDDNRDADCIISRLDRAGILNRVTIRYCVRHFIRGQPRADKTADRTTNGACSGPTLLSGPVSKRSSRGCVSSPFAERNSQIPRGSTARSGYMAHVSHNRTSIRAESRANLSQGWSPATSRHHRYAGWSLPRSWMEPAARSSDYITVRNRQYIWRPSHVCERAMTSSRHRVEKTRRGRRVLSFLSLSDLCPPRDSSTAKREHYQRLSARGTVN